MATSPFDSSDYVPRLTNQQTLLIVTDQQHSVFHELGATGLHGRVYTVYGHHRPGGLLGMRGFNGECPDLTTGHYLLGNGYRAFNPVLMRFNSPDSLSPFDEGGLNGYPAWHR